MLSKLEICSGKSPYRGVYLILASMTKRPKSLTTLPARCVARMGRGSRIVCVWKSSIDVLCPDRFHSLAFFQFGNLLTRRRAAGYRDAICVGTL